MRGVINAFEVRISIEKPSKKGGDDWYQRKTIPILANSKELAESKAAALAKKCGGKVIGLGKMDKSRAYDMSHFKLAPLEPTVTQRDTNYPKVMKMDEMFWLKRNKRRAGLEREKQELENKDKNILDKWIRR